MKFIISAFWCASVLAAPINIYFEKSPDYALAIRKGLREDYKIPDELMEMKETEDCSKLSGKAPFELCLKNNGDLLVVSVDDAFINESLKIFRAP